jgi:hypothetical protein
MEIYNEMLQGRAGLSQFLATALSGYILSMPRLKTFNETRYNLFCTPKDIYSLDYAQSRFDILTPVYTVGQVKVTNGSAIVYGGLSVDTCDTDPVAWADGSVGDVTPSRVTTSPQEGTAFVRLTVAAGAGVELLAYHDISSVNLSAYDSIGFWIRSSVATNAGDFQFVVDNTAACASPLETIDIPALSANTWTWVNLAFVTPGNLTAVVSIGIKQAVDKGACTIDLDGIVVGDWSDKLGVGDYFKIGSTGIHTGATWYEILTVDSDTKITLAAVYAGSSADQQTYAVRLIFQGSNTDIWDWEQFFDSTLGEIVIMTNGVDTPVYWDGSSQAVALTGLATGFTAAKYVDVYKDRVIFLYTTEGGADQPQRERWSEVGNAISWLDIDFHDFVDEPTFITGTARLSGYHIVFKENNAYVGRHIGGTDVFDYDLGSECQGCRARFSIVEHKDFVAYYGADKKFHKWNLLQDEIISEQIFSETNSFDPNTDGTIQGAQLLGKSQIRWFCPYGDTDKHNYCLVWDYSIKDRFDLKVWEYEDADATACFGVFILTSDVYADDAVFGNLYADQTLGYADDVSLLSSAGILLYGGYDGIVRIADSGINDDGATYTRLVRFKRFNFNMPDRRKRLEGQRWWLEPQSTGDVTIKLRLDDSTDYNATTKTISLVAEDNSKEVIKMNVRWNKHAVNFQPEISSTDHFGVLGFENYVFPKGYD